MHPPYTLLISASQLKSLMAERLSKTEAEVEPDRPLLIFDCSFELMQAQAGDAQFQNSCIRGALRADLDRHLSAKGYPNTLPHNGGRHPLPDLHAFVGWLAACGLTPDTQVVVYDRQGANYCGRLWWMLKWVGHEAVALLDGGLQAWTAIGGTVSAGSLSRSNLTQQPFIDPRLLTRPSLTKVCTSSTIEHALQAQGTPKLSLLDARPAARFRGEHEPLDPVAGHIPGALNRPFQHNFTSEGFFKPAEVLRKEFIELLQGRDPASVVHHCGSGVSANPNLLAMEIAGLGRTALYPGSWSEWCSDPARPVAKG
jgi:thiosulfate/3-mercaptopyruvate sulfurtransferase